MKFSQEMKSVGLDLLSKGLDKEAIATEIHKIFGKRPSREVINRWILDNAKAMCAPKL